MFNAILDVTNEKYEEKWTKVATGWYSSFSRERVGRSFVQFDSHPSVTKVGFNPLHPPGSEAKSVQLLAKNHMVNLIKCFAEIIVNGVDLISVFELVDSEGCKIKQIGNC